ncbi:nucleotide disphospho-sugar-binding domain-containing protein [Streptomyces sp. NPDC001709]
MRVLFVSWAWPSHLYPLVPLAWEFRNAGQEVLVATQPALIDAAVRTGLPTVPVGSSVDHGNLLGGAMRPVHQAPDRSPAPQPAAGSAPPDGPRPPRRLDLSVRIAEDMVDDLDALCASWKPSLIVSEPTTYVAPLVAAAHGIPHASVLWGVDFHAQAHDHEREAFAELSHRLGIDGFDSRGVVQIDPCPASLQVPSAHPRLALRHVPYNGSGAAPRWVLGKPDRPRICLSWGLSAQWANTTEGDRAVEAQHRLIEALAETGAEIVVPVADLTPFDMVRLPPGVRIMEQLPLHLLLPTCDVLIARGGAGTMMAGVTAGVPQLCLPQYISDLTPAERLAGTGAGLCLSDGPLDPAAVRDAAQHIVHTPSYRSAAVRLREEAASRPPAATVVRRLESLAREAALSEAG